MASIKDWLPVTKAERIAATVILMLMALAIAVPPIVRSFSSDKAISAEEISSYQHQIDSLQFDTIKKKPKAKEKAREKEPKHGNSKPRTLEEVPTI